MSSVPGLSERRWSTGGIGWRDGRLVIKRSSETAAERLELAMSLMERLSPLPKAGVGTLGDGQADAPLRFSHQGSGRA